MGELEESDQAWKHGKIDAAQSLPNGEALTQHSRLLAKYLRAF
jgi:hypothetical protein